MLARKRLKLYYATCRATEKRVTARSKCGVQGIAACAGRTDFNIDINLYQQIMTKVHEKQVVMRVSVNKMHCFEVVFMELFMASRVEDVELLLF